jgi:hypothetical protein
MTTIFKASTPTITPPIWLSIMKQMNKTINELCVHRIHMPLLPENESYAWCSRQ